jgi:hypothetical protein
VRELEEHPTRKGWVNVAPYVWRVPLWWNEERARYVWPLNESPHPKWDNFAVMKKNQRGPSPTLPTFKTLDEAMDFVEAMEPLWRRCCE